MSKKKIGMALLLLPFLSLILIGNFTIDNGRENAMNIKNSSTGEDWVIDFEGKISSPNDILSTDSNGNIYIVREMKDNNNISLIKYDATGSHQWNKSWGGSGSEFVDSLYIDSSDKIYLTGSTPSFSSSTDIFVVVYDISGNLLMNTTWGSSKTDHGYDIAVDTFDNIYVSGYTNGIENQSVLVKFNSTGHYKWNITWGEIDKKEIGENLAIDSLGNINVLVQKQRWASAEYDIVLLHCSSTGSLLGNTSFGMFGTLIYPSGMDVDSQGNMYVTGLTDWPVLNPDYQFFLIKFSPSGLPLWSRVWGDTEAFMDLDVAVDSSDNIYVAGYTRNHESGFGDIYLAKFSPDNEKLWYTLWDSGDEDFLYDIVIDKSNDDLYLAGMSKAFSIEKEEKLIIIKNPSFPEGESGSTPGSNSTIPGFEMFLLISTTSMIIIALTKKRRIHIKKSN